jgi:ketosteroid isomerase-like protein
MRQKLRESVPISRKEIIMADMPHTQQDLEILTRLNADYLTSDQNGDVRRYEQILAEDFATSLPDLLLRDKNQFLEMMAAPRPFTELKADDVNIRLLGDFAIIHAHMTFRTADGVMRQGRYTDDWQRRDGKWLCVLPT